MMSTSHKAIWWTGIVSMLVFAAAIRVPAASFSGPVFTEHQDIGPVAIAGDATYSAATETYTITASGADVWGNADEFHYLFAPLSGNIRISATLQWVDLANINPAISDWSKLGIMFRESVAPGSKHVYVAFPSGNTAQLQHRPTTDGTSLNYPGFSPGGDTLRVRVTRMGSAYAFEYWQDSQWVYFDGLSQEMPQDMLWGIACTSHNNAATVQGLVSELTTEAIPGGVTRALDSTLYSLGRPVHVTLSLGANEPVTGTTVTETVPAGWAVSDVSNGGTVSGDVITWNLGAVSSNMTLTYTATPLAATGDESFQGEFAMNGSTYPIFGSLNIAMTAPFDGPIFAEHADIGGVGIAGDATYNATTETFTITASGGDIWGTADQFHYLFAPLTGNLRVAATLKWVDLQNINDNVNTWAKLGIMFRESANPGDKHVFLAFPSGNPAQFQYRPTANGESLNTGDYAVGGDTLRLRATRLGNTYTYEVWQDTAWTLLYTLQQEMPDSMFWGIACTSHNNAATAQAEVSDLVVEPIPGIATRSFDSYTYHAAQNVQVSLDLTLDSPSTGTTLTETVPAGWAVSNISHGGTVAGGTITWNLGDVDVDTTLTYTITTGAVDGDQTFGGNFTMSGITLNTFGATVLTPEPPLQVFNGPVFTHHGDLGSVCLPGDAGYDNATATWTNAAAGSDIWGTSDNFHFAFAQTDLRNFSISGKLIFPVLGLADLGSPIDVWSKIGFMVRKNLSGGSVNVMAVLSADSGSRLQYRPQQGAESITLDFGWKPFSSNYEDPLFAEVGEAYVRLTKTGNSFVMEYKLNAGDPWTYGTTAEVDLGAPPYYWGFAVTSHTPAAPELCSPWLDIVWGDLQDLVFEEGAVVNEPPVITDIEKLATSIRITWDSQAGVTYGVMAKESIDAAWVEIATVPGADGSTSYEDTNAVQPAKFYSVVAK